MRHAVRITPRRDRGGAWGWMVLWGWFWHPDGTVGFRRHAHMLRASSDKQQGCVKQQYFSSVLCGG